MLWHIQNHRRVGIQAQTTNVGVGTACNGDNNKQSQRLFGVGTAVTRQLRTGEELSTRQPGNGVEPRGIAHAQLLCYTPVTGRARSSARRKHGQQVFQQVINKNKVNAERRHARCYRRRHKWHTAECYYRITRGTGGE